jgi:hypothetical protein
VCHFICFIFQQSKGEKRKAKRERGGKTIIELESGYTASLESKHCAQEKDQYKARLDAGGSQ